MARRKGGKVKIKISTHKPNSMLWLIALLLFIYALLPLALPYQFVALLLSAGLLLLGTTII
jgi:hypothetical protein